MVFQRRPRQRILIVTNAKKATETQHGVRDPAAELVDHCALDPSEFFKYPRVYGGLRPCRFQLDLPSRASTAI
jgi:hypothetical protein